MAGVYHHLARRAMGMVTQSREGMEDQLATYNMPQWAAVMIYCTFLLYIGIMAAISYTYGDVVATLAMIETPTTVAVVVDSGSDHPDAPLLKEDEKSTLAEPELALIRVKPITAKFRTTIKHLRARAGRLSRFRGLGLALVYNTAYAAVMRVASIIFQAGPFGRGLTGVIASILLCQLQMTWTHIVVSEPSPKPWYRRVASADAGRKVLATQTLHAFCKEITIVMPAILFEAFGLREFVEQPDRFADLDEMSRKVLVGQFVLVGLVGFATTILLLIPAEVTLRRVQASMLPEEDEAIVPFDRTFGGKVVPEVLGGSGKLEILDAWKSFDWSSRIRLMKIYAKVLAVQAALTIVFVGVITGEMKLIMGPMFDKMVMVAKAHADGGS